MNMFGYKNSILKGQSFTEVKMGYLQKNQKAIIEQCQNNVPQCQILKAWNISPPTVHNIIKRVWESGEISEKKKWKNRNVCALECHYIKMFLSGMFLSWKSLNGLRNTSTWYVHDHSSPSRNVGWSSIMEKRRHMWTRSRNTSLGQRSWN